MAAATGIGVVAVADMLIPKPLLSGAAKCLAKCVVEPFLDPIERGLSKICKLRECQVNPDEPREKRAEQLAKTLLVFGAAYAASLEAKFLTRHGINRYFGLHGGHNARIAPAANATTWQKFKHYGTLKHWSAEDKAIMFADEGMHLGALYLMNNTFAPFTDRMIKDTTGVIQKQTGWTKEKSHEVASMMWVWEAANGLGALAGMGIIAGNHKFDLSNKLARLFVKETHVDKLAKQSALSTHAHTL
ncbi:MAG: hypothetical protein K2Q01_05075 [Rickettsiales bacterium]|nr:hypothetical protein [Rickettsiales bacterium]